MRSVISRVPVWCRRNRGSMQLSHYMRLHDRILKMRTPAGVFRKAAAIEWSEHRSGSADDARTGIRPKP